MQEQPQPIDITLDLNATSGQRFCNYIIDVVFFYLIMLGFGLLLGFLSEITGNTIWTDWLENISKFEDYLFSYIVITSYYIISESVSQRTVGKYVTNTITVTEDGFKPDFKSIVVRSLCRLIPLDGLTFLGGGRGWHDSISNTYVVKKNILERKQQFQNDFEQIGVSQE